MKDGLLYKSNKAGLTDPDTQLTFAAHGEFEKLFDALPRVSDLHAINMGMKILFPEVAIRVDLKNKEPQTQPQATFRPQGG